MRVSQALLKCVAFVGMQLADGSFKFAGSVFFVGKDRPEDKNTKDFFAVTARHVIDGIRRKGLDKVWLRLNGKDGTAHWVPTNIQEWHTHPTDSSIDAAVYRGRFQAMDHLVFPLTEGISPERITEFGIGLGDEVFVMGLFRHHHGTRKNIPIVRIGNIACLTEERVSTRYFGEIDAHLIEARSIGGLSGSPVFINLGQTRVIDGKFKTTTGNPIFLFGLIHGHYDIASAGVDSTEQDENALSTDQINTGIAIVVPLHSVISLIDSIAS